MTESRTTVPIRGSRGPYAKSAEVRDRAVAACVELFGQTGFHGVSMREIAQRAGISHTGLMHHFANKTEPLDAALRAHYEQFRPMLQGLDPDADQWLYNPAEASAGRGVLLLLSGVVVAQP